jgi:putative peptide zinc metalloprotease protein
MDSIIGGYQELVEAEAEVIQIAPNLLEGARSFLRGATVPYPFVCDPDKRLYAVYGLGDLGVLAATRTAVVSFAHAFTTGDGSAQIRGVVADIRNRNFVRRLHHHATTALEQGLFFVDRHGIVRHRAIFGPSSPFPTPTGWPR